MTSETNITDRYQRTIRNWGWALAKHASATTDTAVMWSDFEMGIRDALLTISGDLGWSDDEWDAVEAAAHKQKDALLGRSKEWDVTVPSVNDVFDADTVKQALDNITE